ncbi:MAG: hypothetical protein RL172_1101 [Bacteroidota bacterium]|jgi:leucyl/phenylalanyl-tRNA---protein transferase
MFLLNTQELYFPPASEADADGLLAIGGDLRQERLLLAYRNGIFPWYSQHEPIMWWCPDPRFVLLPDMLVVSKTMQQVMNKHQFTFTHNQAFEQVIEHCKTIYRPGQDGTWITPSIKNAYLQLHQQGYAHSAEAWHNGELAGGLYGIKLGNIFFGESMFSKKSNASKFAFISYVRQLQTQGVVLIDCQIYSQHLQSMGAVMISRQDFLSVLKLHIQ